MTITGAGPQSTTIEQTTHDRIIDSTAAKLAISELTLTGGHLVGAPGAAGQAGLAAGAANAVGGQGESEYGSAISANGALTLTDDIITGNTSIGGKGGTGGQASSGTGGAGGQGGTVTGAISIVGPLTIVRTAVVNNTAVGGNGGNGAAGHGPGPAPGAAGGQAGFASGGGIVGGGKLTITDSLIAGNVARGGKGGTGGNGANTAGSPGGSGGAAWGSYGGGIHIEGGTTLYATNVTITGNQSQGSQGGNGGNGVHAGTKGGAAMNSTGGSGGGIAAILGPTAHLASVTLAANTSASTAVAAVGGDPGSGGVHGTNGTVGPGYGDDLTLGGFATSTVTLADTILAGGADPSPTATNCYLDPAYAVITSIGHNLDDGHSCIPSPAATDHVDMPAGLGALANNGGPTLTIALAAGSAAIAAGASPCLAADGVTPVTTDQRGLPRTSPCDIGAFQTQPANVPAPPIGVKVSLTGLTLSHASVRRGHSVHVAFALNADAGVTFRLTHRHHGHIVTVVGAPRALVATAGANRLTWKPSKKLSPGAYQLSATPDGGPAVTTAITIRR